MPTPDELRAAIEEGRDDLRAALRDASPDTWETKPQAGDGESAWSPREAAEHVIGAELFFATEVCKACGYPGVEMKRFALATPAEALQAFDEAAATAHGRLKHVSEADLAHKNERFNTDVAGLLGIQAHHLKEHAAQVRGARAGG